MGNNSTKIKWKVEFVYINRTDNGVKNHFYSKMRKGLRKLNKMIYKNFKREIK
jgi:hypothetical protein